MTEETTAFADAMIFDGMSAELRDGCVRVAAGTIVEVSGGPEPGDRVIDCRGRTVVPGLIDAHFHAYGASLSLLEIETSPLSYLALAGARRLAGGRGQRGPLHRAREPAGRAGRRHDGRTRRVPGADAGPLALLRAATSVNAELLGRDDLGRIRSGAVADLLVLDGDPLRDPSVLWGGPDRRAVFQGGTRVAEHSARLVAADGGAFVSTTTPGPDDAARGVRTVRAFARSDAAQLAGLVARVDAGDLKIDVAQRRPLADLPAVHDQAAAGLLPGKTILIP